MPQPTAPRPPTSANLKVPYQTVNSRGPPITAPQHGWFTSPARSHADPGQGKELPLHLIQLILEYLDDAGDLARITRTSRLFYYMTLPRLYENVTLKCYAELRYVNGRPEGYGNGSPFAIGLNTLVSRTFSDYVQKFRVIGEWREHDVDDYSKGRVPDNSMMLQVAMRAALDKMKNLTSFAWELNTKPLQTVYEGLMHKSSLTSLVLRCPTRRMPRPATTIPPLPNLNTFVMYDIDPLCYPDNISLLLLAATRLQNLKMHWSPRMREAGEESVNLHNYFSRCVAARHRIPLKRIALYNLYARKPDDDFENVSDPLTMEEITLINCMGTSDPMTVFLDDTWRLKSNQPVPHNLKMMRGDVTDKEHVVMLGQFRGLERLYLVNRPESKCNSTANTPSTPITQTTNSTSRVGTPVTVDQCKGLGGDYLAVIQSNHRTMRHLLLSEHWRLSDEALYQICRACPHLEQLGFASSIPPLESLRQIMVLVPKLWAIRLLVRPGSELAETFNSVEVEMHQLAIAREFWRPEYRGLKYFGLGDKVFKFCEVVYPPKEDVDVPGAGGKMSGANKDLKLLAKRFGPLRRIEEVERTSVGWIEIWGMDSTEFEVAFP